MATAGHIWSKTFVDKIWYGAAKKNKYYGKSVIFPRVLIVKTQDHGQRKSSSRHKQFHYIFFGFVL